MESAGGSREVHPEVSEHGLKEDAIGFRDALTGFACAIYYRHELTKSVKNF